jgi:hypothetical protein|tara:strand:+ start:5 stop:217 length:213 start_codon:yes stop_codon:yes gene_type:complete
MHPFTMMLIEFFMIMIFIIIYNNIVKFKNLELAKGTIGVLIALMLIKFGIYIYALIKGMSVCDISTMLMC